MEMSGALNKVSPQQCGANTRVFVFIGKKGCEMKKQAVGENSCGFTNGQSPQGVAFSGDLLDH